MDELVPLPHAAVVSPGGSRLGAIGRYITELRARLRSPSPTLLARRLETALMPGDQVLWCGSPRRLSNLQHLHTCAVALMITVAPIAATLWTKCFTLKPHAAELAWWGVWASACAVMYAGLFARQIYVRDRTIFGLTKDAVIIRRWNALTTIKIDLVSIPYLTLEMGEDDVGAIHFGHIATANKPPPLAFEHIRHARQVFDLVRQAQRERLAEAVVKNGLLAPPTEKQKP